MNIFLPIVLLVAVLLGGCVQGSPYEVGSRSGDKLAATSNDDLVWAYGSLRPLGGGEKLRAEIERRSLFTPEEWALIDEKKIQVGAREWVVWCAWGPPDDVDNLTTAGGSSKWLWWSDSGSYRIANGVRIDGGVVSAVSN